MTDVVRSDEFSCDPSWLPAVARIQLSREHRANALTAQGARDLANCIRDLEVDGQTRCAVIAGSKRAFCAGADLAELASPDALTSLRLIHEWTNLILAVRTSLLPVVTVVEGPCLGGGYHLNLVADLSIVSDQAWFRHSGSEMGVVPMMAGTLLLPLVAGWKRASKAALLADRLSAEEGLALGICSEVVPEREVWPTVERYAATLSKRDPVVLSIAKAQLNVALGPTLLTGYLSELTGFLHTIGSTGTRNLADHRRNLHQED